MISVITPTYNEKENIGRFIKEIASYLNDRKKKFELIVVDDNSPDGTADLVDSMKREHKNILLLKRSGRLGLGSAYFDGFSKAKGDILIGIDADFSSSLASIDMFIKKIEKGYDMAIGSRYMPRSKVYGQSVIKLEGSRLFNSFTRLFLNIPYSDITHSFRAVTKAAFDDIRTNIKEDDHPSFFIEFSFWIHRAGYKVSEVPIVFRERKLGKSKLNLSQGLKNGVKTLIRLKKIK